MALSSRVWRISGLSESEVWGSFASVFNNKSSATLWKAPQAGPALARCTIIRINQARANQAVGLTETARKYLLVVDKVPTVFGSA